jgi:hypothetical protein
MITSHKITKEQVTTYDESVVNSDLEIGNSRFGFGVIMVMAGFVGVWGCLCLISGISQSSCMQELGRGIIMAFTGI